VMGMSPVSIFALIFIVRFPFLKPERDGGIVVLLTATTNRAAARSMGGGFSLFGVGFTSFPSLNIRQFPTRAAGGQVDRLGEAGPTARGQVMNVEACADLAG
jgi:hypothetical protein